jgi:hypothetical protein
MFGEGAHRFDTRCENLALFLVGLCALGRAVDALSELGDEG